MKVNSTIRLKKGLTILLIGVLALSQQNSFAQVKTFDYSKNAVSVELFEVVDISFNAKKELDSPFKIDFGAVITSPSGKEKKIQGFYYGEEQWRLRFSANEKGTWKYVTYSELRELNGKTGAFQVSDSSAEKHGGIIISSRNRRKFSYEDGTSYYPMAYECDWLFALDYHNDENAPKTTHFLDVLEENGCTQIVMNAYTFDVSWPKDEKLKKYPEHDYGGKLDMFPFLGDNENPDYSALNPEFFKKLDRTIGLMNDRDIVSHLMIYVWNKLVNWPEMYSEADNMYFDYVVNRYQAFPNIIFDISKEALYYGRADDEYILERIERARKLNAYNRLVTVHDFGFCRRYPEKVDFISLQDWTSELYTLTKSTVNKYKDKPIMNIEHGGYEESPYKVWTGVFTNPEVCLRRNYLIAFGGGYTTYYWQGCSWNVLIHNPFEQPEGFIKPKFEYYRHMTDFFQRHDFTELKPEPKRNRSSYCLTNGEGKYLFYVPKENYMIQPNFLRKDFKNRSFVWFNTLTGEYKPQPKEDLISKWQRDLHIQSPWEGEADAVLITEIVE